MTCPNNVCGTGIVPGPKPGDPDNNIALTANVAYGGIDVKWTYPTSNSHAVAHTLLYRGTTNNRDAAIQIAVVAGNQFYDKIAEIGTYFYWIQVVSVNGTVGDFIGPASATTRDRGQDTVEDITGQIDRGVLGTALRQDIARIALNYDELTDEIRNRIAGDAALSGAFADLEAGLVEAVSLVHTEITTRQDGDNALAQQMTIIAAANAANASAIIDENTARVTADEALTRSYQAVLAATEKNAAAIVDERLARTTADSSLAQQISTTQSTLGNQIASVQVGAQTQIDATNRRVNQIGALWTARVSVNGLVGGFGVYNNGEFVEAGFDVDRFWIGRTQANKRKPFIIENGTTYIDSAVIREASIDTLKIAGDAVTVPGGTYGRFSSTLTMATNVETKFMLIATYTQGDGRQRQPWYLTANGIALQTETPEGGTLGAMSRFVVLPAGTHTFSIYTSFLNGDSACGLTVLGVKR